MIPAILRAQLLSMRMRRGGLFTVLSSALFYGVWLVISCGVTLYFSDPAGTHGFAASLSTGLLFVTVYWQFAPVISASFGASLELKKLLVYPIPRGQLFFIELLLRLTACAEMPLLLSGAVAGLLRNPAFGVAASPTIVTGAVVFAVSNLLVSAGVRSLLEQLLKKRRVREVMMPLLVVVGLLPQVLLLMNVRSTTVMRFLPSQVFWPWSAAARIMLREAPGAPVLIAMAWLVAAYGFGRWQFQRGLLGEDTASDLPRSEGRFSGLLLAPLAMLPDPMGALVEKELRMLVRTPRFRQVWLLSCFFGIVMYLPFLRRSETGDFTNVNALPIMAGYGLLMLGQVSYWNCLGFDRSAAMGYFLWPLRFREVLIAKNLSVLLLTLPQILVIALVAGLARLPVPPAKLLETLLTIFIAALYWLAAGNLFSVRMPRAMDPERMGQMSSRMQALSIWAAPFLLLPIGLAYWAREIFHNGLIFGLLMLLAAAIGAAVYGIALESAERAAVARRESLLSQLSRSDGPIST